MGNKDNKALWRTILWGIAIPVAAIVITVFVAVAKVGFEWNLVCGHKRFALETSTSPI